MVSFVFFCVFHVFPITLPLSRFASREISRSPTTRRSPSSPRRPALRPMLPVLVLTKNKEETYGRCHSRCSVSATHCYTLLHCPERRHNWHNSLKDLISQRWALVRALTPTATQTLGVSRVLRVLTRLSHLPNGCSRRSHLPHLHRSHGWSQHWLGLRLQRLLRLLRLLHKHRRSHADVRSVERNCWKHPRHRTRHTLNHRCHRCHRCHWCWCHWRSSNTHRHIGHWP